VTAVEYVSFADATGYGRTAVGFVRLLLDMGVDVHWTPFLNDGLWADRIRPPFVTNELARGRATILSRAGSDDRDFLALVRATSRPVRATARIIHLLPRFWLQQIAAAPEVPHIGMTVWETSRINREWLAPLAAVNRVIVPCLHNAAVLDAERADGAAIPPVCVVPHPCRTALAPATPEELADLARALRIRTGDTVFYCIAAWDPRKRMAALIEGFAQCFAESDPAILVVKTSRDALFDDPDAPAGERDVVAIVRAILDRVRSRTGRAPGRISVIARDELPEAFIDRLHALGQCFVSLSRCEGWGNGSFDAATFGRPVIAVGYGGPVDYMGADWFGRIPHRMVPCDAIAGFELFASDQLWPEPDDAAAFAMMRGFMRDPAPFVAAARPIAASIRSRFSAAEVGRQLLAAVAPARGRTKARRVKAT
jgi:glycosyltransferase involved in cell wall biosynthesis